MPAPCGTIGSLASSNVELTRRQTFDAIRAGPAFFAGLSGDEVDIDRLTAYLATRAFEGGICVADQAGEGVLWIRNGEPGEAWFFDASGHEAVLPSLYGHDLLRDIAARGGVVSVVVGAAEAEPPVMLPAAPKDAPEAVAPAALTAPPAAALPPAVVPPPVRAPQVPVEIPRPGPRDAPAVEAVETHPVIPEPPSRRPWPGILREVNARVVEHRGPRLAALFTAALAKALAEHGGAVEGDRVIAPPLPESTWRVVVESACAPIVSIAGRAFTDRTIAAAERAVRRRGAGGGEGE